MVELTSIYMIEYIASDDGILRRYGYNDFAYCMNCTKEATWWRIVRTSDNVVIAQSKSAKPPDPVVYKIRNENKKVVAQVNRPELVAVEQRLWSATELVKPRFGETRLRYADINGHKVYSPKTSPSRDLQAQKGIRPANMQKKAKTPISSQNTISYADALRAQYRKAGSVRIGVAS
jgi:hypothetical protein